jgi:hypothetical protein
MIVANPVIHVKEQEDWRLKVLLKLHTYVLFKKGKNLPKLGGQEVGSYQ